MNPDPALALPVSARALRVSTLRRERLRLAKSDPSVVELNRLIWRISRREDKEDRLLYLDPTYGGVDADVVVLLKAPQADPCRGAGRLISLDNNDSTAETLFDLFKELSIDRTRCVAWNICPFPLREFDPDEGELRKGKEDFRKFLGLLKHPKTVLVLGAAVGRGWHEHSFGSIDPNLRVVCGPSPSPPGITKGDNLVLLRDALRDAFA
ncbi:uracil-DNA glycosylase family protein [Gordonia metallireducens]|uniref:hypothetical protein n=1 Tax=Gordonia metallireducens TaxID=2897779 RepID=UPI001E3AB236|nr:hypothetical protein [Gordonia metallireducens]